MISIYVSVSSKHARRQGDTGDTSVLKNETCHPKPKITTCHTFILFVSLCGLSLHLVGQLLSESCLLR